MMEAVRTSKTSVNFNVTTRRYIPEDCKLLTRRRENLKSLIQEIELAKNKDHYRAGRHRVAGRIWPAGRYLNIPTLCYLRCTKCYLINV
jgi:hypothetical protein